MTGRARLAALLLAVLGGCGVKAPPRAAGAPDRDPPNDLFRPVGDPDRHGARYVPVEVEPGPPPAPAAPPGEPSR